MFLSEFFEPVGIHEEDDLPGKESKFRGVSRDVEVGGVQTVETDDSKVSGKVGHVKSGAHTGWVGTIGSKRREFVSLGDFRVVFGE